MFGKITKKYLHFSKHDFIFGKIVKNQPHFSKHKRFIKRDASPFLMLFTERSTNHNDIRSSVWKDATSQTIKISR
jgi:hypothetical protein